MPCRRAASSHALHERASARRAFRRLGQLSAVAALLFPSTARAEDRFANVGFFLGYTFGERPSLEWGFQASFVELTGGTRECAHGARSGYGPLAQVGLLGLSRPRVTLGAFTAAEFEAGGPSIVGELGGSLRFDEGANFGLHTGGLFEATWPHVYARQEWIMHEYSFGGGLNLVPTLGLPDTCRSTAIVGRPLRDAHGTAVLPSATSEATPLGLADDALAWHRDAETECTSIRAFLDLARELLAAGAPLCIVHRALDAAEDEVHHARICAAVATRMAGRPLRPVLVDPPIRPLLPRDALLARLAVESYVDGCLGEGSAAERARTAADTTSDRLLLAAHRRIATDEAHHAELGWDIVRWALATGGPSTRRALADGLAGSPGRGYGDDCSERVAARARRRLIRALELSA